MELNEFLIEDIFSIPGRGIVISGRLLSGRVKPGMKANISDKRISIKKIETFKGTLNLTKPGQTIGLLLEGIDKKEELKKGETLIFA